MRLTIACVLCLATACRLCDATTGYYYVGTNQCIGKPVVYEALAIEAKSINSSAEPQYWCNISFTMAKPDVQAFNLYIEWIGVQPEPSDTIVFSVKQSGCPSGETLLSLNQTKYESQMYTLPYDLNCLHDIIVYQMNGGYNNMDIRLILTAHRGSCTSDSYVRCVHTKECISKGLYCDGFPNCADQSDETDECFPPTWSSTSTALRTTAYYGSSILSGWVYYIIGIVAVLGLLLIATIVSCIRSAKSRAALYTRRPQNAGCDENTNEYPLSTISEPTLQSSTQEIAHYTTSLECDAPPSYEDATQ